MLGRERVFTLASTLVLALGIGAATATFTLLHSLLLQPLPYPQSSRLVWIAGSPPRMNPASTGLMGADFQEIRDRSHSFQRVAGFVAGAWIVSGQGDAETIQGARVTPGFFETLGVMPMLGRAFLPDEYRLGHEMEVIFNYPYWQRHFGGDPGVVGRRVTLDGVSFEVVGIMPPGFPLGADYEMWAPLQMDSSFATGRRNRLVRAFGRLKENVTMAQAQAEANAFAADFDRRFFNDKGFSIALVSFLDRAVGGVRPSLWILAAAVGCFLLIACSNVASLLLARGAARVREMALRAAVGAGRGTLIRQSLIESTVLAMLGGVLGLPVAILGVKLLVVAYPRALPRASEIRVDPAVLGFALVVSLLTGVLFGVLPAVRVSRVNLVEVLKEGGRGGSGGRAGNRFRAALVVVEVALGVVLTASAGLLGRSFEALTAVDPGFQVDRVLTLEMAVLGPKYRDMEECRRFFQQLLQTVSRMPGVQAAGSTNWLPLRSDHNWAGVWTDTQPVHNEESKILLDLRVVTPGLFQAMGARLIDGRLFDWTDRVDTPKVFIVNQAMAREFFPDGKAIGHRITIDVSGAPLVGEIVGIVGNFHESTLAEPAKREIFTAYNQTTIAGQTLVVRTSDDPARHTAAIRQAIAAMDPNVPVYSVRTMRQQVDESLLQQRLRGTLFALFSAGALVLAAIGLFGVVACAVAEREQEIGIRMALGARDTQVRGMIVRGGIILTAAGLFLGLAATAASSRFLAGFLYGVTAADPVTFLGTSAVFIAVALGASYFPARRATRVNPLSLLREE
jgi:putative ABC transport system permease protein